MTPPIELTLSEAIRLPAGSIVPAVRAFVTEVKPPQTKNRPDGSPYVIQVATIEHDGLRAKVHAFDQIALDGFLNTEVMFASMKSRNGRFGGLVVDDDVNRGNLFDKSSPKLLRLSHAGKVFPSAQAYYDFFKPEQPTE